MEFEDVSEKFEWEVLRIAAAFELVKAQRLDFGAASLWLKSIFHEHSNPTLFSGHPSKQKQWKVEWCINSDGQVTDILVGNRGGFDCVVKCRNKCWYRRNSDSIEPFSELMARGLYRLGIEDDGVPTELNYSLSAHEKLELRLSMSREFWPKTWLDEDSL